MKKIEQRSALFHFVMGCVWLTICAFKIWERHTAVIPPPLSSVWIYGILAGYRFAVSAVIIIVRKIKHKQWYQNNMIMNKKVFNEKNH